jgi:CheY-like chemotaxis protein
MFVLTDEEKRVICFVMLAILVGLTVKEYRRNHPANATHTEQLAGTLSEAKQRHRTTPVPSVAAP